MYKFERYSQLGLADFNQPAGLKMNPENRWVNIFVFKIVEEGFY